MVVSREMTFTAYHSHHGMLSEPLHPHEFTVQVGMRGEPNEEGFICDFRAVKRIFQRVVTAELSGRNLDDVFAYPTSENLAVWIWDRLLPFFPLDYVEVREKPHSRAVYRGPEGSASRGNAH